MAATAAVGGLALTGCGGADGSSAPGNAVAAAEAQRPHTGRTVTASLRPRPATIDLGGTRAATLAYGDTVPGPLLRATAGDDLVVTVNNELARPTSVHWHGIALRNDMDGAAPATHDIDAGREFTYRFSAPHPGTYWAHPHTGLDADTGLYLPVVIDDPAEPGRYDAEWIVVLDDWTDGIGSTPRQVWRALTSTDVPAHDMPGMGEMPGMVDIGTSALLGGDAGDVNYPYYLINGRIPSAPSTFTAVPGQRIRIRIINAGSDTAFRVALAGHSLTVTHTDGFAVVPVDVDAVLVGMGERYDVIVTAGDGVFPLVAAAEGKDAHARALLRTGAGSPPEADFRPGELTARVGTLESFTATPAASLPGGATDVTLTAQLTGSMTGYDWSINGRAFPDNAPLMVQQGQRVTLVFDNATTMWHPMHLHGHTFQTVRADGTLGARKDTAIILPRRTLTTTFIADNPGVWMLHCHNTYHQEAGMMTTVGYTP
ncbi:multicopper oxidase family protein [Mycobacterium frederiksbergense]|uniref:Multicopper oxidase family protein n=1 Tax=Mycolicibacterium frederiksbergense TaxID=117567 RepID=A0A6H0SDW1_9MYCO|nr:multicopper oxidase family protein [Mycolicibacterium frederiksbergense]MCV7047558.1 multicopper oxidase family protein [Mycolicibacterium frederiksbergense]QIV85336.1 multicopper oxidase family protein [Mycolicibacterium frederiksbergense]